MNLTIKKHEVYDMDDALMIIPYMGNSLDVSHVAYLEKDSLVIWGYLNAGFSESDIVDKIAKQYRVSKSIIEKDVHDFILDLAKIGIVEYQ